MLGKLLRYGYHKKVDHNSKWITGIGLIVGERKVKQTKLNKMLYESFRRHETFNNTIAKPQEYDTLYTVLLADGSRREFVPTGVMEIL